MCFICLVIAARFDHLRINGGDPENPARNLFVKLKSIPGQEHGVVDFAAPNSLVEKT